MTDPSPLSSLLLAVVTEPAEDTPRASRASRRQRVAVAHGRELAGLPTLSYAGDNRATDSPPNRQDVNTEANG